MNIRKLWLAVFALLFVGTFVSAQEQRIKEEGKMVFKPHWFIQMQAGVHLKLHIKTQQLLTKLPQQQMKFRH